LILVRRKEVTATTMTREIVHIQAGQCGNQIGAKVINFREKIEKLLIAVIEIVIERKSILFKTNFLSSVMRF